MPRFRRGALRIHVSTLGAVLTLLRCRIALLGEIVFHRIVAGGEIFLHVGGFGTAGFDSLFHGAKLPGRGRLTPDALGSATCMSSSPDPTGTRRDPPVTTYAIILGVLILAAIVYAVIAGQRSENPRPAGNLTSPRPNASIGPSPRY